MSKKRNSHLRGKRGQAFADLIRGTPSEQILCVSLDISKYFHVVMIYNGLGEIVKPAFEIDLYQHGFDQLCQAIDQAKAEIQACVILVGSIPTSHYFENLARHLLQHPQPVTLINSFAVKQNRGQQLMHREKTDPIDCGAIGDLLRRGEGTPYKPARGIYLQLQQLDRARIDKVKIESMLKNQVIAHLDRIFPGLVILGKAARERYTPLFQVNFWQCQTLQHLLQVCPNPHQLASMTPGQLVQAFRAQNYRLGHKTAAKIIARAQMALLPGPELVAIRSELLQHDLHLLEVIQAHIAELEQRLTDLVAQTPFQVWVPLKGLSTVQVASLAAAIGDPDDYTHAGQIFRRSGLVSGRNDSGNRQQKGKGNHIIKVGDVYLRRALMNAVTTLILHQPVLSRYHRKLSRKKHSGVARVATARKMVGILWATLCDQYPVALISCKGAHM